MKNTTPFLENLTCEVVYAGGYRYLDRCGQTMLDLEALDDGWIPGEVTPASGRMHQLTHDRVLDFNTRSMSLAQEESDDEKGFLTTAARAFGVIRANLGLEVFVRLGIRYQYLLAAESSEEAEKGLARLKLVSPSDALTGLFGNQIDNRAFTFGREATGQSEGLRMEVSVVRREKGRVPPSLLKTHPRKLPKNQREALLARLQEFEQFRKDPRFAIAVDLDVHWQEPEEVALESRFETASAWKQQALGLFTQRR